MFMSLSTFVMQRPSRSAVKTDKQTEKPNNYYNSSLTCMLRVNKELDIKVAIAKYKGNRFFFLLSQSNGLASIPYRFF